MKPYAYLKSRSAEDDPSLADHDREASPVLRPFVGDLVVGYVLDTAEHFEFITEETLKETRMGRDDLHAQAITNLEELAAGRLNLTRSGPISRLSLDGNFEASLLLLNRLWDKSLRATYATAPVVAVPARDVLAYCDARSKEGIAGLRKLVENVSDDDDQRLSPSLFVRQGGSGFHHRVSQESAPAPLFGASVSPDSSRS